MPITPLFSASSPAASSVNGPHLKSKFLAVLGIAGAGAAATYGSMKMFGASSVGNGLYVPSMVPGSYDMASSGKLADAMSDADSEAIYKHNRKFFGGSARREELAAAVARNDYNRGAAQTELTKLESERAEVSALRESKFKELDEQANASSDKLKELNSYREKMEAHKKSPLWRGLHLITFRDPDKAYNEVIERTAFEAIEVDAVNLRVNQMRENMASGYVSGRPGQTSRSPQQMQNDFFPAYNR